MRNLSFTFVLTTGHWFPMATTASALLEVSMVGPYHVVLHPQNFVRGPEHYGNPPQGFSSME